MNDRSPASPLQTLVWVTKVSQTNTTLKWGRGELCCSLMKLYDLPSTNDWSRVLICVLGCFLYKELRCGYMVLKTL